MPRPNFASISWGKCPHIPVCSSGQIDRNVLIYAALVRVLPAASAVYHKVLLLIKMMNSYDFTSIMVGQGRFRW